MFAPSAHVMTEVLTPAARPLKPPPKAALGTLAVAFALALLPLPSGELVEVIGVVVGCAATLAALAAAHWSEDLIYSALAPRPGWLRLTVGGLLPGLGLVFGLVSTLALAVAFESLGAQEIVVLTLFFGTIWFSSAATGTLIVLVAELVAKLLSQDFRSRISLTVLGLLGAAVSTVSLLAVAIPSAVAQVTSMKIENLSVDLGEGKLGAGELAELMKMDETSEILGLLLLSLAVLFSLPAVISACGKLAELAMERVHPLDQAFGRIAAGDLDVRVEEGGGIEFRRLARRFNEMVESLVLAQQMERAFSAYVSQPVIDRIRAQHGRAELPARARDATVFFADVRDFTSLSERLEPQQVMDLLDRYYEEVIGVVDAHEGYIDKFIGDAVYVVFNGPIDQPDHVERCCRCAIDLQRRIGELNAEAAFPEIGTLDVGVGVTTGPVVAGNLGTERSTQFSVIGDTVNLASRLSGQAPSGEVWINARCRDRLPEGMISTPLEPLRVKGKAAPVDVARLWPT